MKNENHQFFKKEELLIADQCLSDFVKWLPTFFVNHYGWVAETLDAYEHFHKLPFAMRSGVYLAFFREKGIDVVIGFAYEFTEKPQYFYQISNGVERKTDLKMYPDYNTALTEAIKQANQIYNEEKE